MDGWILALELSTSLGSVAVVDDFGAVVFEATFQSERSHNSQVFAPLGRALAAGDSVGRLRGVVVGTGPGSYTGVRIAIAAAHGVALSRGIPVVGLPSLEACVEQVQAPDYGVIGDARRGRYYLAEIRQGQLFGRPILASPADLRRRVEALRLNKWVSCDSKPLSLPIGTVDLFGEIELVKPRATRLADLARMRWGTRLPDTPLLEPYYLEGAFITEARPR